MSDKKQEIELEVTGFGFVIILLFFIFWLQGGWYRLDCALGVQKACDAIAAEKEYQPKTAESSV